MTASVVSAGSMASLSGSPARQSGAAVRQVSVADAHDVAARVEHFLRERYPHDTVKLVARDTGVPAKTVAKWLERMSAPSAPTMLALIQAYGPEMLVVLCPGLAWVERALLATRSEALRRQLAALDAQQAATLAQLSGAR